MPGWKADERLYLDATRTDVLREGDVRAKILLCGKGTFVPEDIARKYKLGPFAEIVQTQGTGVTGNPESATGDAAPSGEESDTNAADAPETGSGDDSGKEGPADGEGAADPIIPPPAAVPPDKPVRKR